jgi:hypothetical protein
MTANIFVPLELCDRPDAHARADATARDLRPLSPVLLDHLRRTSARPPPPPLLCVVDEAWMERLLPEPVVQRVADELADAPGGDRIEWARRVRLLVPGTWHAPEWAPLRTSTPFGVSRRATPVFLGAERFQEAGRSGPGAGAPDEDRALVTLAAAMAVHARFIDDPAAAMVAGWRDVVAMARGMRWMRLLPAPDEDVPLDVDRQNLLDIAALGL